MATKYIDNEELRLGFVDLLEFDYPQLKATDVTVEDSSTDAGARVTFTIERPTLEAIETAKKEQEELKKLLEQMESEYSQELATE